MKSNSKVKRLLKQDYQDEPKESLANKELKKLLDAEKQNNEGSAKVFDSGFTRKVVPEAYHLICPELERRVSLICAEGLAKHRDENVKEADVTTARFGGPPDNIIRHAKRHFNLWLSGDRSEDHLAKVAWAIQELMHDESDGRCQHYNLFLKEENRVERKRKHL